MNWRRRRIRLARHQTQSEPLDMEDRVSQRFLGGIKSTRRRRRHGQRQWQCELHPSNMDHGVLRLVYLLHLRFSGKGGEIQEEESPNP